MNRHLNDLFKALLEQNLIRVIMPYSKVEINHLAKLISLDAATVEREVSQMILDKKISGALFHADAVTVRLLPAFHSRACSLLA